MKNLSVKMQKKKLKWRFIWTNNGTIKMKKDYDSQIMIIDDENMLEKLDLDKSSIRNDA